MPRPKPAAVKCRLRKPLVSLSGRTSAAWQHEIWRGRPIREGRAAVIGAILLAHGRFVHVADPHVRRARIDRRQVDRRVDRSTSRLSFWLRHPNELSLPISTSTHRSNVGAGRDPPPTMISGRSTEGPGLPPGVWAATGAVTTRTTHVISTISRVHLILRNLWPMGWPLHVPRVIACSDRHARRYLDTLCALP